jgi:transcriptional regulator with XRE-family HTH domain
MTPIRLRLQELREARELSQLALAKASGVSQSLISRIESGELPNVTLEVLEKLADALSVPPADLLVHTPAKRRR